MTIDLQRPRAKFAGNMDSFVPSPDFYSISGADHTLPNTDITTYAASPNSLYMYEQEKHDMQNSLGSSMCNPSTSGYVQQPKDEFDLKPQYELSNLDLTFPDSLSNPGTPSSDGKSWNIKTEIFDSEMSSDTIFQTDKSDVSTGPTLAELNMDESLIDEVVSLVNADSAFARTTNSHLGAKGANPAVTMPSARPTDFLCTVTSLPNSCAKTEQKSVPSSYSRNPMPMKWSQASTSPTLVSQSIQSSVSSSAVMSTLQSEDKSTLHKLLMQRSVAPTRSLSHRPQTTSPLASDVVHAGMKRSASVAKIGDFTVEEKWKEIEKYIHPDAAEDAKSSSSSKSKRSRHDSGSSAVTSAEDQESENDVFSDRDSDLDDDLSDEEGTLSQLSPLEESLMGNGKKKEKQYFWQYNVQSKGPKGTRLRLELDTSDPHHFNDFEDPVFDPNNTQVAGIRHGGKARKGDGNDVHPNPKRLCQIGMQIKRLNRKINEVTSGSDATSAARNHSRKEKNKLASRACRLKKKAQHEANKVKLYGLKQEHEQLMDVMVRIKAELKKHILEETERDPKESLVTKLEELIKTHLKVMIAGNTANFVNKVIENYEKGDPAGGLDLRKK